MKLLVYNIESTRDAILVRTFITCLMFFLSCAAMLILPVLLGWNDPSPSRTEIVLIGQRTLYLHPLHAQVLHAVRIPAILAAVTSSLIIGFAKKEETNNKMQPTN